MRSVRWLGMVAVTAILVAGCSSTTAGGSASTPRGATPCQPSKAATQFAPSVPSTRNLALVSFKGTQQLAVRDITVIVDPVTVSRLDRAGNFVQFVSANDLSAADEKSVVRMPLSGAPRNVVACANAFALAWNPVGTAAAYITQPDSSGGSELHLVTGGQNRVLSSLTGTVVTGCAAGPCQENVFVRLSFSPNGNYISYVQTWGGPVFRLWASDGKLIKSIDGPQGPVATTPSMAVWSGDALYWRDAKGVEMWRLDNETLVLPDVAWIAPSASPGGKLVTYTARDAGLPSTYILDTASGQSRVLTKSRSGATFLNSHLIWYREERGCVAGDVYPCGDRPTIPSGKTYIYDLEDKTETESIIAAVFDVWPRAA